MNEPLLPAPPAAAPASDRMARRLALLAVLAAAVASFFAWEARQALRSLETAAGGKLAELGAESAQARTALAQAQVAVKDSQARIVELESRVAETQESRVALEDMYRELSRSADDRLLAEIEQILVAASQQLQLAGNVRGALAALQAADQRLARAEKLAAAPLRRALGQDMDKLKALPLVDTVGIAVKIDNLITTVDALPLVIADTPPPTRVASRARTLEESGFSRAARDFWDEMKALVRIRDLETADSALLTPSQAYFLRENLKLRLLAARVALLARDEVSFRDDVKAAQAWLARYFDVKTKGGIAAAGTLRILAESPVSISVPDINGSLAAVRTARTAREKGR